MKKEIIYLFLSLILVFPACQKGLTTQTQNGIVQGELGYPSELIPELAVYLVNQTTNKIDTIHTVLSQNTFEFKNVLPGKYVAYAFILDSKTNKDLAFNINVDGGGYTNAVACGLTIKCTDHNLIVFNVKANKTTKCIKIFDWYGAVIPNTN